MRATIIIFSMLFFIGFPVNRVYGGDKPVLQLRGKVTSIEVQQEAKGKESYITIKLDMELFNAGTKPILLLRKKPSFPGVVIAKTPDDFETGNALAAAYLGESNSSSPEWANLRKTLDQPAPPAAETRILLPEESWRMETAVSISVPTSVKFTFSPDKETFDVIRKLSPLWIRVNSELWSFNIEELDGQRSKLNFGHKLQERWKDSGFLWIEELDSEPILLDLSTARFVKKRIRKTV